MRIFLRILFIFIYLYLSVFIRPSEVFGINTVLSNTQTLDYISAQKYETKLINYGNEYYFVQQNPVKTQISSASNKNNNWGILFNNILSEENNLKYFAFEEKNIQLIFVPDSLFQNLKNEVYTRAP